jgi:hypothetical protein
MQWLVALGTELKMVELPETGGERTFGPVGSITEFDPEPTFRASWCIHKWLFPLEC